MEEDGLSNEQVEKVLQLQDLTGIEDINVCRDMLVRHQWDIEVSCVFFYSLSYLLLKTNLLIVFFL